MTQDSIAPNRPRAWRRSAVASVLVVLIAVGSWFGYRNGDDDRPTTVPRPMSLIVAELDEAQAIAETCRSIIDKPLRCLP